MNVLQGSNRNISKSGILELITTNLQKNILFTANNPEQNFSFEIQVIQLEKETKCKSTKDSHEI